MRIFVHSAETFGLVAPLTVLKLRIGGVQYTYLAESTPAPVMSYLGRFLSVGNLNSPPSSLPES